MTRDQFDQKLIEDKNDTEHPEVLLTWFDEVYKEHVVFTGARRLNVQIEWPHTINRLDFTQWELFLEQIPEKTMSQEQMMILCTGVLTKTQISKLVKNHEWK